MTAAPAEEVEPEGPDEPTRVLSYRELMFRSIGFNDWQAVALAESRADWHDAERLVKSGCPLETAVDLLL